MAGIWNLLEDLTAAMANIKHERREEFRVLYPLPTYMPKVELKEAHKKNFSTEALLAVNANFNAYLQDSHIEHDNIDEILRMLLQIEDITNISQYPSLVQRDVQLQSLGSRKYSITLVHEAQCKADGILTAYMDEVVLVPKTSAEPEQAEPKYPIDILYRERSDISCGSCIARIEEVLGNSVVIRLSRKQDLYICADTTRYDLIFRPLRMPVRYQFLALNKLINNVPIRQFLCPKPMAAHLNQLPTIELELFNKEIATNPEQLQAIRHIVQGTNMNAPYLVFGPPGTGKTSTLAEAILQVRLHHSESRILVTAGSNSACDTIALRICEYFNSNDDRVGTLLGEHKLMRIYSKSFERKGLANIASELLLHSNCAEGNHYYPAVEVLHRYGIIVATLSTVGKLVSGKIGWLNNRRFFTHIFIDEAAASTEPETLVGIMGIWSPPNCRLILCGDQKQLGPVLKSRSAIKLGLGQSMLERLSLRECYAVDSSGNYDQTVQTRLRRNYRSHPEILGIFNHLYYDDELLSMAKGVELEPLKSWSLLPNAKFPIIFQAVHGKFQKCTTSPSSYNDLEVDVIMWYLQRLLVDGVNGHRFQQSDIGVITPYKLQGKFIEKRLKLRNWQRVDVGSVETFQGREKQIIIISFVRSFSSLGFIKCPKRLNVMLSRAKSLMIIIGNPVTLRHNTAINYIIEQCKQHGNLRRKSKKKNKAIRSYSDSSSQSSSRSHRDLSDIIDAFYE